MDQIAQRNYKGGLFWSKSIWNYATAKAVIVTLEDGRISMKTADNAVVFDVPLSNIAVRFLSYPMTMILTVNGTRYNLGPQKAGATKDFTLEQLAELQGSHAGNVAQVGIGAAIAGNSVSVVATSTAGQAVGSTASAAGLGVAAAGIYAGEDTLKQWESVLNNNGVAFVHKSFRGMNVFVMVVLAIVVITMILSLFAH